MIRSTSIRKVKAPHYCSPLVSSTHLLVPMRLQRYVFVMQRLPPVVLVAAMSASVAAALSNIETKPHVTSLRALEQNWTDAEAMGFYNAAQGLKLILPPVFP